MLEIEGSIAIPEDEIDIQAVRAQGPGGQNVNKVAAAIHLRFDIGASSLPDWLKARLLKMGDQRVSTDGVVVIKAQRFRSQGRNREDALERLADLVRQAMASRKPRKPTRPTRASQKKRLDRKTRHGRTKSLRGPVM